MEPILNQWGGFGVVVVLLIAALKYVTTQLRRYAAMCETDRKALVFRLDTIQDRQYKDGQEIQIKGNEAISALARALDKMAENERRRVVNETATQRITTKRIRIRHKALQRKAHA